ncbi:MAG: hypothetical protein ACJA1E_001924 [Paracoccaceae bacterium]
MKRVLLDACVLYPSVMREMLLAVAKRGGFAPLWSDRILEEWARATLKLGPVAEAQARGEIALIKAFWTKGSVTPRGGDMSRLWLPDADDVHVLASAIAGSADSIMTLNANDFPRHTLAEEGLQRVEPDGFLYALWLDDAALVESAAAEVVEKAAVMDEQPRTPRQLFKKARLPKLAKALG